MERVNLQRIAHVMVAGLFWAVSGIAPVQAGQVVGQVTAVDTARDMIEIDGFKYELSEAAAKRMNARDVDTLLRGFKPGQAVLYEVDDRRELKRIEGVAGGADFPARLKSLPRVP